MSDCYSLTPEQQRVVDAMWEDWCKRGLIQERSARELRWPDIKPPWSEEDSRG